MMDEQLSSTIYKLQSDIIFLTNEITLLRKRLTHHIELKDAHREPWQDFKQ